MVLFRALPRRIAILGTALLLLVACADENDPSNDYSELIRTNFLNACERSSGGKEDACACMLEELESRMTQQEYIEWEQGIAQLDSAEEDPIAREVLDECA